MGFRVEGSICSSLLFTDASSFISKNSPDPAKTVHSGKMEWFV
jgi:hypothetical protein